MSADKAAHFDRLFGLTDVDDNAEDTSDAAEVFKRSCACPPLSAAASTVSTTPRQASSGRISHRNVPKETPSVTRVVSAPAVISKAHTPGSATVVKETPIAGQRQRREASTPLGALSIGCPPQLRKSATGPVPGMVSQIGKRKRTKPLQLVPEAQRVFRGQTFYFIPNNDISPARKMRINKALEYGAVWEREWHDGITHVVVDRGLTYDDVIRFLKLTNFPTNVALVNELYPSECIIFRMLMDPRQSRYEVQGYKKAIAPERPSSSSDPSQPSLQLKSDKGRETQPKTPSRTDEDSSAGRDGHQGADQMIPVSYSFESSPGTHSQQSADYVDPLQDAIKETKAFQHLPLDNDESDGTPNASPAASDSEDSADDRKHKKPKKGSTEKMAINESRQDNFQCMQKHDVQRRQDNPNSKTIEILQEMADYYARVQDTWRPMAYRRAIATLRKQNHKVTSKEEAAQLPFVGERLAAKIEEIVWTNRLRRLDNARAEPKDEVMQKFVGIYGCGFSQASKWISQGFRTLDDLLTKASLNANQEIGIAHYEDFLSRIPRSEVEAHGAIVRQVFLEINRDFSVTIGGSYRRGAADSGDIDLIVTKPGSNADYLRHVLMETVIPQLFKCGFLQAGLQTGSSDDGSKWHGASKLPGSLTWRRIDFLLVPWAELGAALIYFTGNDIFNRSIRLLASKKGMRLNQRGLWKDVIRGQQRQRVTQGTLVEGRSERRIFEVLGVPWRPPEHRIC